MDDKEIDDMFFRIYDYEWLNNEYKEAARKSSAYIGFRLYIKLKTFINAALNIKRQYLLYLKLNCNNVRELLSKTIKNKEQHTQG